jgi:hypothetical protein
MIDQPFSGSMVPISRYRNDRRVVSVMIEVNRGLYMDEESGVPLAAMSGISTAIRDIVTQMIEGDGITAPCRGKMMGCQFPAFGCAPPFGPFRSEKVFVFSTKQRRPAAKRRSWSSIHKCLLIGGQSS